MREAGMKKFSYEHATIDEDNIDRFLEDFKVGRLKAAQLGCIDAIHLTRDKDCPPCTSAALMRATKHVPPAPALH